MNDYERMVYLNKHTENGISLFDECLILEDKIIEIEKLKKRLIKKFVSDNKILKYGDRIKITWPNGMIETIDIHTDAAAKIMHERNEYDIVYGYRLPNKDNSLSKIGALRTLWQGQLFVNGYIKLNDTPK